MSLGFWCQRNWYLSGTVADPALSVCSLLGFAVVESHSFALFRSGWGACTHKTLFSRWRMIFQSLIRSDAGVSEGKSGFLMWKWFAFSHLPRYCCRFLLPHYCSKQLLPRNCWLCCLIPALLMCLGFPQKSWWLGFSAQDLSALRFCTSQVEYHTLQDSKCIDQSRLSPSSAEDQSSVKILRVTLWSLWETYAESSTGPL
mgnify:CR=1 FL=1